MALVNENGVNSREWWNKYFNEGIWEENFGSEQTLFFAHLALTNLPEDVESDIRESGYSCCDIGCANGDAILAFSRAFPSLDYTGIDFSQKAVDNAKVKYPKHRFINQSILEIDDFYDIVYCSNVLEHFEQPREILRHIFDICKKYAIILVPYNEKELIPAHVSRFDDSFF
ncbi:MAG: class I SAM-dependent methyltransferase, partial [Lachnoclostridium sp.]|nr:class I SAM-dependent methyltransferase [Lachnoclostridium sp.]